MAIRDISFYKYLEAAFRHKLFRERDATSFNYLGFNLTYDRIFYYARRVLPSLYSTKFPDTEAGNLQMAASVLQNLDRAQDQELKSYFDPATAPEENIPVIEEATQESTAQQAPAATPVAAGPLPGVGIRPPSIPRMPSVKLGEVSEQLGKTQKTSEPVASAGQTSEVSQPTIRTTRGFNLSGFRPPVSFVNTAKNFGSAAGRFFQRNVGKFFTAGRIASVVSGGIGAIVGAGLTNNHPIGIFGGAGAGAAGSFWIKSGDAARFLGKVGNGAINIGVNISNQVSSGATRLSMSSGSKKWALGLLGAFILFFGISLIGNLTGTTPPGQAGPLPPPPGGSGCPDTSGNRNPATCRYLNPSINLFDTSLSQSAIDSYVNKYSSIFINADKGDLTEFKKRVDYIVSNTKATGLNPAMFLGYWKTESMFSTMGDRDMGCAGSDFYNQVDCSLGINLFSDPAKNPVANCAKSKDAGGIACTTLKGIRAKVYDLTHPIKYPIATFDDFAEAYGPYDDLVEGQPTNCTHTYNELIETAKELGSCTPQAPTVTPPPADKLQQAIIDQFGVTMVGFDTQHLQWTYTKFSDVSQTKFIQLISGTKITAILGDYSRQTGCKSVNLGQYQPEELFKIILTHELGHIIANCSSWLEAQRIKHFVALSLEGPLTYYARNAQSCTGSDTNSEDYADMLTYYLNPNSGAQSAPCDRGNPNPYTNGQFPMHRNVAQEVLGRYP